MCSKLLSGMAALTLIFISQPATAYAYLDPGTVTYVIQIVIAALIGGVYAFRSYIIHFWHLISGKKNLEQPDARQKPEGKTDGSEDAR